jgi:WD40 repeat protein
VGGGSGGPGGPSAVFAASEDGAVACWDVRAGGGAAVLHWRAQVSEDYIGGATLSADGHYLAVGAADGELSLLDVRAGGGRVAAARCGTALRSCCGDGRLAVAGAEGGVVQLWDLARMAGGGEPAGFAAPGPDGLYPGLQCLEEAAVNGVAAAAFGEGEGQRAFLCAALESGHLSVFGTH